MWRITQAIEKTLRFVGRFRVARRLVRSQQALAGANFLFLAEPGQLGLRLFSVDFASVDGDLAQHPTFIRFLLIVAPVIVLAMRKADRLLTNSSSKARWSWSPSTWATVLVNFVCCVFALKMSDHVTV